MKKTLISTSSIASLALTVPALAESWEPPMDLPPAAIVTPIQKVGDKINLLVATGGEGGIYYAGGQVFSAFVPKGIDVERIASGGSWDNVIRAINGEVQVLVAQPDAIAFLEREYPQYKDQFSLIGSLHREYAQVICNRENVDFSSVAGSLESANVSLAIVGKNSGANLMFGNWIAEDSGYASTDIRYFSEQQDAVTAVKSGSVDCLLMASGLSATNTQDLDNDEWRKLRLVAADDKDLNDAEDSEGNSLYEFTEFPDDALTGLDLWDTDDGSGWSIETVTWEAGVYAFMPAFTGSAGADAYDGLVRSVTLAGPAMQAAEDAAVNLD